MSAYDDYIRRQQEVALSLTAPPELLEELSKNPDAPIRKAVAMNPNTPVPVLHSLSVDPNSEVCKAVIGNKNVTPEILSEILETFCDNLSEWDTTIGVQKIGAYLHAVWHPLSPLPALKRILDTRIQGELSSTVRREVFRHPSIPVELLEKYSRNEETSNGRLVILSNPNTSLKAITYLLEDEHPAVREKAAGSRIDYAMKTEEFPDCPREWVEEILKQPKHHQGVN